MSTGDASTARVPAAVRIGLVWLGRILALLFIAVSLLIAVMRLPGSGGFLGYLASRGTVFDIWGVLSGLELLFLLIVIVGTGLALLRRKLLPAVLFSVLAWPMGFVIEGSRCDTESACRMLGWAALPADARDWNARIRPVADPNEAKHVASSALYDAGSRHHAYKPKRFRDHWIVSTIDDDGWPGPRAVKVDARTAHTSFVPCPAHLMLCGMERPVISDGRRVFSDPRKGVAAVFPSGQSVCTSRTENDEPWGFHGMRRPADIPCDIDDPSRTLGLAALEARTLSSAVLTECLPLTPAILRAFGGRAPSLPGHESRTCAISENDQVQVSVFATAEAFAESGKKQATVYEAYLVTTRADLAEDARAFEAFLHTARIGAPARPAP